MEITSTTMKNLPKGNNGEDFGSFATLFLPLQFFSTLYYSYHSYIASLCLSVSLSAPQCVFLTHPLNFITLLLRPKLK